MQQFKMTIDKINPANLINVDIENILQFIWYSFSIIIESV